MKKPLFTPIPCLLLFLLTLLTGVASAQQELPEQLETGTLLDQYDYLDERTRIYNGYRAIREDMFQQIRANSNDSLAEQKEKVIELQAEISEQGAEINKLNAELSTTNSELELAIKNRDRLKFLGIPMHKALYNTILWVVIGSLAFLSVVLFLSSRRMGVSARRNKNDLEEMQEEFEAYRQKTRIEKEQLVVKHHNEMKKLKGKQ